MTISTEDLNIKEEKIAGSRQKPKSEPPRYTLDDAQAVYRKWFGPKSDIDALKVTCAVAASEQLDGDPAWLLLISGPGALKTETAIALAGVGGHVISTIASEGALLSATPKKDKSKTATGGLLRKIGERGILVIKDVTSILSAARKLAAWYWGLCVRFTTATGCAMSEAMAARP